MVLKWRIWRYKSRIKKQNELIARLEKELPDSIQALHDRIVYEQCLFAELKMELSKLEK